MNDNVFIIPEEVNSEIRLMKGLYFFDLVFVGGFYLVMDMFSELIHPFFQIPYIVFNIVFSFILTRPSFENPGKRKYFSFLYKILKHQEPQTYHKREASVGTLDLTIESFLDEDKEERS